MHESPEKTATESIADLLSEVKNLRAEVDRLRAELLALGSVGDGFTTLRAASIIAGEVRIAGPDGVFTVTLSGGHDMAPGLYVWAGTHLAARVALDATAEGAGIVTVANGAGKVAAVLHTMGGNGLVSVQSADGDDEHLHPTLGRQQIEGRPRG